MELTVYLLGPFWC
ncbi:hypothetical protein MACJ_004091 [Theileria orientalis]|uniref:Uncharacterized protein n=1 Tax=Theileria orientalis TaxID=68886 RepID=A0A976SL27_THEOR|nr:hypothetical protein MACJ_004091 [Theileria orientalis]